MLPSGRAWTQLSSDPSMIASRISRVNRIMYARLW